MRLCRPVRPGKKQWPLLEDDCEILRSSADYMRRIGSARCPSSMFCISRGTGTPPATGDTRLRETVRCGARTCFPTAVKYYNIVRVAVYNPNREYEYEFCFVLVFFFHFSCPPPPDDHYTHEYSMYIFVIYRMGQQYFRLGAVLAPISPNPGSSSRTRQKIIFYKSITSITHISQYQ